jgi:hypothetical protein
MILLAALVMLLLFSSLAPARGARLATSAQMAAITGGEALLLNSDPGSEIYLPVIQK